MNLNETQNLFKRGLMGEMDPIMQSTLKAVGQMSLDKAFKVYSHSYIRRLTESLKETFPAVHWVLGHDLFHATAASYIDAQPSLSYQLEAHGKGFPEHLIETGKRLNIPFLYDIGRFELLVKDVYHTPTPHPLSEERIEELIQSEDFKVRFIEAFKIYEAPYSIYEVWRRRHEQAYRFEDVHWSSAESLLIYKREKKIYVQRIETIEAQILANLKEGNSVANSLSEFAEVLTAEKISRLLRLISSAGIIEDVMVLDS